MENDKLDNVGILNDKPEMIYNYDKYMGWVDKYDMMSKSYTVFRKSLKWTRNISFYMLDLIIHNLNVLYKKYGNNNNYKSSIIFRIEVANHIYGQKHL